MAVSDNEIVVRDQKVAGSNPVTSTKSPLRIGYNLSGVLFYRKRLRNPAVTGLLSLLLFRGGVKSSWTMQLSGRKQPFRRQFSFFILPHTFYDIVLAHTSPHKNTLANETTEI